MLSGHFLFFFAMLGAFNGLGLAAFLWWRAQGKPTQRWLALLVFMVSVRTGKSVAYFFWPAIPKLVLQVGLTACFLIGPCLFFLVRSSQSPHGRLGRVDHAHLATLLCAAGLVGMVWPYSAHPDLWKAWITPGINFLWPCYLLLTTALLARQHAKASPADPLLLAAVAGTWVIWLAYFSSGYTSYIVGALSFTFVLAASVLVWQRQRSGQAAIEPYQDRRIPQAEAGAQLQALAELMARERLHCDPGLTLPRLARRLALPPARLSQLLNDNNQTSFKQYLTQLRVEEAKGLLRQAPAQPLDAVAEAAGFLSMSTFHSAFKKLEGVTPAVYRAGQTAS